MVFVDETSWTSMLARRHGWIPANGMGNCIKKNISFNYTAVAFIGSAKGAEHLNALDGSIIADDFHNTMKLHFVN